ncbi:MAG: hypothetical protein IAF38_10595 [Bacteroidia bacterium]|nr:hypothetical protein [Bacteroidia bacterium]
MVKMKKILFCLLTFSSYFNIYALKETNRILHSIDSLDKSVYSKVDIVLQELGFGTSRLGFVFEKAFNLDSVGFFSMTENSFSEFTKITVGSKKSKEIYSENMNKDLKFDSSYFSIPVMNDSLFDLFVFKKEKNFWRGKFDSLNYSKNNFSTFRNAYEKISISIPYFNKTKTNCFVAITISGIEVSAYKLFFIKNNEKWVLKSFSSA